MKLNIYKNQKDIEKTYETDCYDLMFGTVEDLLALIDLDKLSGTSDADFVTMVMGLITGGMDQLKPLIKDIFPGVTDAELKRTKVKELVPVFVEVLKYSVSEFSGLGGTDSKNR